MTVPLEEAPANYVPAAAVRRRGRALFGIIGRKALVGGIRKSVKKDLGSTQGTARILLILEAIRG